MWEEKANNQLYAVVDVRRAKTVSTLKTGITIAFEGYQRERRRGKVLFLGKVIVDNTLSKILLQPICQCGNLFNDVESIEC